MSNGNMMGGNPMGPSMPM